ncbi:MAG: alpha/beta hydrolase fold domain-containing protein [Bacteroidetes bacterium]|nr:alpha/beta hydrolase fold domain-containing protein [Bacteroidota bacterium]
MKKAMSLIILVLAALAGSCQSLVPAYSNVDYVGNGNSKQMLDIYIPSGVTTPTALIIHIHGGAFMMGSKGVGEQPSFVTFFNNGYICADINYRLSGDTLWPAQIHDCKAAVRFLKVHAAQYHIDTCKIGVIGESAGGNLVSMLGTTGGVAELEGLHLGSIHASSRVQAVVDLFGPVNFLTMDAEALALGFVINTNSASSPESKLMGAPVQTIPELVTKANPTTYISADDAAFFISAGDVDQNIPYTQGQNLCAAMVPIIGSPRASFELMAGQGHGGSFWHNTAQDAKYLTFFNTYLDGNCGTVGTIDEGHIQQNLNIYPNPFEQNFTIQLPQDKAFDIHILDVTGQTIMTKNGVSGNQIFNGSSFDTGIYLVQATGEKMILTGKLMKQ